MNRISQPASGCCPSHTSRATMQTTETRHHHRATIFCVGQDPNSRDRLAELVRHDRYTLVAYPDAESMLDAAKSLSSGLVIFEMQLSGLSALDAQVILGELAPALSTLFFTARGTISGCARALKAGAHDFLEKPCSNEVVRNAIVGALNANVSRRQRLAEEAEALDLVNRLTSRELEVFRLVSQGFTNPETARLLGISAETVKVHRARVMRKLEADSVPDLVFLARDAGLV